MFINFLPFFFFIHFKFYQKRKWLAETRSNVLL
jgi:hypothetical protein